MGERGSLDFKTPYAIKHDLIDLGNGAQGIRDDETKSRVLLSESLPQHAKLARRMSVMLDCGSAAVAPPTGRLRRVLASRATPC